MHQLGLSSFVGVIRGPFEGDGVDGIALMRSDCLALLRRECIGRLGISLDALPAVIPVNYLLADENIVFRVSQQSKLFRASNGSVVALETDGYEELEFSGWTVLVQGVAREIIDPDLRRSAEAHWQKSWPLAEVDRLFELPTSVLCGWRFRERRLEG